MYNKLQDSNDNLQIVVSMTVISSPELSVAISKVKVYRNSVTKENLLQKENRMPENSYKRVYIYLPSNVNEEIIEPVSEIIVQEVVLLKLICNCSECFQIKHLMNLFTKILQRMGAMLKHDGKKTIFILKVLAKKF